MTTSIPPPSSGGGNLKYAIIGVLLLLVAGTAIFFKFRTPDPGNGGGQPTVQTPAPAEDSGTPTRVPTVGAEITLPEPESPDAGEAVARTPGDGGRRIRYVTRYVSACPGTVDPARVAAVVRSNYGGLRECYNRQLRVNPTLRGNVTAQWVINTNGTVGSIATAGAVTRDRSFKSCFESALSRLRFPQPQRGCATFEQSFTFTPSN